MHCVELEQRKAQRGEVGAIGGPALTKYTTISESMSQLGE